MNLSDAQVSDLASSLVGIVEKFYQERLDYRKELDWDAPGYFTGNSAH